MGTYNAKDRPSREAGTDVTKNRFVVEVAGGIVDRVSAAGAIAHGVAYQTQVAGDEVAVTKEGDVIVEAGAAVVDAAEVMSDAVGRAITYAAAGTGLTNHKLGKVVNGTSAGAAGEELTIELYVPPIAIKTP